MGSIGPVQLIVVAILILVLFGRGKISEMMGDFGKGVSSFKKGMNEEVSSSSPSTPSPSPAPSGHLEGPSHDAKPAGETVESSDRTGNTPS